MSTVSEISTTPYDGASVSYLGDWDAPSALVVNNSVGGDVAIDQSMATTSTQGGETGSEDWTMDASLASDFTGLSLNAFSVSTLGGGNGNEAILNGAETPHEAPRPTTLARRSTGITYPSAATRPGVSTPGTSNTSHESLHSDYPHGSEKNAHLLADIEDAIHRALDGGIGKDKVRELFDRAEAIRAEAMRASSNDDDQKPAAREGTRVRTESDSRMESIAEEVDQPMGFVANSSSVLVPHIDSSDCDPLSFTLSSEGATQDYSMDQMSSATFQDNVARMLSDNVNVQQNGFMYEPPGSRHSHAHSPNGDATALSYYHQQASGHQHGYDHHLRSMVSTERYEANHNDLSVYPNLLQPPATAVAQPAAAVARPTAAFAPPMAAVSRPLIGFKVVKITNRAPSEVGAHGEVDASFVSTDSSGEVAIYLFDAGSFGSRVFYEQFKMHHVSFASAPDRAQKGKIHGKLMAGVTRLHGQFLEPAAIGGVVEMQLRETSDTLEAFLKQKCYVDSNRDLDVLMGRGGHSTNYPGNQRYLEKRDEMRQDYVRLEDNDAKNQMGQKLVNWVYANGGRFVTNKDDDDENGVNSSGGKGSADKGNGGKDKGGKGNDRWYILKNDAARSKAKQALRDRRSPRRTI